jgi:hypothetical protein
MTKDRAAVGKIESWMNVFYSRATQQAETAAPARASPRLAPGIKQQLWILLGAKASYRLRFSPGPVMFHA